MAIETERKFLIELPDADFLASLTGCRIREIIQTYLKDEKGTGAERRVRKINDGGKLTYVFTRKEHVTKMSRIEDEREIDLEEYATLYADAKSELSKTRYAFPFAGHTVEIDVYPHEIGGDALDGKAVLEVELQSEDEEIVLPGFVKVIRELTGTGEFSNKKLAKKIKK